MESLSARKQEVVNLTTPSGGATSSPGGGSVLENLDSMTSQVKKGQATGVGKTDIPPWQGVTVTGFEGGFPQFAPPGEKWKDNAVQSYVVILNLVNRIMSRGVCPRVDSVIDTVTNPIIQVDVALILIATGIYDTTI